ncbi:hypothetical protein D3C86_1877100 [compost metagenome]
MAFWTAINASGPAICCSLVTVSPTLGAMFSIQSLNSPPPVAEKSPSLSCTSLSMSASLSPLTLYCSVA